jgi:oligopeptide transport system substrate-binding protein
VPQEAIEEHGDKWTEPGNIWTNGPYLLDTWEHDDNMVMVKNPEYPDAASVQIETINWLMVSTDTALAMYENGELDVASVPDADLDRVQADPVLSKELYATPRLCTYYFGFNTTTPPVDNPHVRRALSYAVDRQTLVDAVLRGGQKPAYTFASPGVSGSPVWLDPDYAGGVLGPETRVFADPDYAGIEFDPEEARRQMEAAGYPGGEGLPKLTLTYNQDHEEIARAIQANWKEHLGIEVELNGQTREVYHETLRGDTPQIYDEKVCLGNYPDEHNWMGRFHSTQGVNRILWSNSEFDQLTEQAAAESDPAKRKDLYARAEEVLCVDEAVIIPIYYYTQAVLTKPQLGRTLPRMGVEHVDEWKWP